MSNYSHPTIRKVTHFVPKYASFTSATLGVMQYNVNDMICNIYIPDIASKNKFDTLHKDKNRLHDKKKGYFDIRYGSCYKE